MTAPEQSDQALSPRCSHTIRQKAPPIQRFDDDITSNALFTVRSAGEAEQATRHGPNELVARQVAGVRVAVLRDGDGRNCGPESLLGVWREGDAVSETCDPDGLRRRPT